MNSHVLAIKWRPQSFNDVVGQNHVIQAIKYSLLKKKIHPAWILSGSRGVGKTTIARIFAMGLSCLKGITHNPCGLCDNCMSIKNNSFLDLIELDSASKTKVEDIREILEIIYYLPVKGRYKIYIFDEFHMLSKHSFNALLKIIEEPPEYVKFIFATTELQKIPITIISRCMQFNLKLIEKDIILNQLKKILNKEKIKYDEEALNILSNTACGSMRDALSLTDQLMSMGSLTIKNVYLMLGLIKKEYLILLIYNFKTKKNNLIFNLIHKISMFNINWENIITEIMILIHNILKIKILNKNSNSFLKNLNFEKNIVIFYQKIINNFSENELKFLYKFLNTGKKNLYLAPNPKIGFEMIILEILIYFNSY
ncbi:DNA polymerase III subunit gamma/tau [Enterobacteriaceae endosymbiont of Donacia bicoloricornis]|uniref:DNA polymerase III subunit gamma/tau n=1 Tax=Enterobacteriaceae endosymbiont of Donacia bicoloricornis TaxID=2675772 RepID=UPI001449833E|nr:DNA polymerase III subunit gamma/tau [Enterobacteriaceae endosymbiont of Donacia bicoloricornis]QJC37850.1 DNA polymerase III subunit gamma/tau [Enterobacteriaceae endosymbiont of Donacia bicoloricornis]